MEEDLVFSAEDVEEAVAAGLESLGLARDQVEVEVLDEGSRGILGIGSKPARVRLTPIPTPPTPPPAEPAPSAQPALVAEPTVEPAPVQEAAARGADVARTVLHELLQHMGLDAEIRLHQEDPDADGEMGPLILDVYGPGVDVLIAQKGEALEALQRITRILVNQRVSPWMNLAIDVEGYKQRRQQNLRRLALQMAQRALKDGRRVALEPMPAYERRIVHMALREHQDVYTESEGMGVRRRVVIIPRIG